MHMIGLVVSKTTNKKEIDDLLEPYFEYENNLLFEELIKSPYAKFLEICSVKSAHALFITHNKEMLGKYKATKNKWFLSVVYGSEEEFMKDWHHCVLSEDRKYWGLWTCPQSFYDYYNIGLKGEAILLKNGTKHHVKGYTSCSKLKKGGICSARIKDVDNLDLLINASYAVVVDGKAMNYDEWDYFESKRVYSSKKTDEWNAEAKDLLLNTDPNNWLTVIDYHS